MISVEILDHKDYTERLRILGSDIGIIMTMAIMEEMKVIDNETPGLNNYLDDMSSDGVGSEGSGTAVFCLVQLLSLEKEVFWHHVHNCRKMIEEQKDMDKENDDEQSDQG